MINVPGCTGIVFLVFGCGFILIMGMTSNVICGWVEPGQVDCDIQGSILYFIPTGSKQVTSVSQAWIDRTCDDDCTYRVMLSSRDGEIPITNMYSSGYDAKRQVADQINDYLANPNPEPMELKSSTLGGMGLFLAIPGIFIVIGGITSARSLIRLVRGVWL